MGDLPTYPGTTGGTADETGGAAESESPPSTPGGMPVAGIAIAVVILVLVVVLHLTAILGPRLHG